MKRFLIFLMALTLALTCVSFASAEEQTTLRIVWWGAQARHDVTSAAIEKFMEKNPDIKVEIEYTDWNGYWSKLATQVAGHLVPDVLQMDYAYLAQYAQAGTLADLTPYITSGALDLSNCADSILSSGVVDGGIYALPTGTNLPCLFYRTDVLEQAGVEMPMEPTFSDLYELCKVVKEKTGWTGASLTGGTESLRMDLRCYGLNLFNDEGTALGFDDPKCLVFEWQHWLQMADEGLTIDVGESTAATAFDGFVKDSWLGTNWSNQLGTLETGSDCELGMAAFPRMDDATTPNSYFKPTMFWAVSAESQVKDAAIRLLDFFTNDNDCFDIVGIDRGMPISSAVVDHLTPNFDEDTQITAAFQNYMNQEGKTSDIFPADLSVYGQIDELMTTYTEQVQYRMVTSEEDLTALAEQFITEANEIIAKSLEEVAE